MFFTKNEFEDSAKQHAHIFRKVYKRSKNLHLITNTISGTTLIYNDVTGKIGSCKCSNKDTFNYLVGVGVAWQKYCMCYYDPIFIERVDSYKLNLNDYFVCCPSSLVSSNKRYRTKQLFTVIEIKDIKSSITNKFVRYIIAKNFKTGEIVTLTELEEFYAIVDTNYFDMRLKNEIN